MIGGGHRAGRQSGRLERADRPDGSQEVHERADVVRPHVEDWARTRSEEASWIRMPTLDAAVCDERGGGDRLADLPALERLARGSSGAAEQPVGRGSQLQRALGCCRQEVLCVCERRCQWLLGVDVLLRVEEVGSHLGVGARRRQVDDERCFAELVRGRFKRRTGSRDVELFCSSLGECGVDVGTPDDLDLVKTTESCDIAIEDVSAPDEPYR
jgi:hypothetical protein